MDDLLPFLIFIVIALANLVKFLLEKGAKAKDPDAPADAQPEREPNSIEEFFENLAEKLEPKPTELPDWPEDYEKPDYLREQEAFEHAQAPEPQPTPQPTAEIIPLPVRPMLADTPEVESIAAHTMRSTLKSAPNAFVGIKSVRIPTMSSAKGGAGLDFSLRDRKALRKAILANVIFSPPRAFDSKFENTIAK